MSMAIGPLVIQACSDFHRNALQLLFSADKRVPIRRVDRFQSAMLRLLNRAVDSFDQADRIAHLHVSDRLQLLTHELRNNHVVVNHVPCFIHCEYAPIATRLRRI